jgi:alkylation response protein AidB-like acyl-CoA dehydrogenase
MQLTPTPDQQALQEAVERFCREQITPERLRAWEDEPRRIDAASWKAIADLGWFGFGLPESCGGSGLGLVEVAFLLQECARGLIPRSVINAIRGGWALAQLDPQAAELADVARGARVVALAFDEHSATDPGVYATTLQGRGSGGDVNGEKWYVANGISADLQIVAAREGHGVSLALVAGDDTERRALRTFDGEEQAVVHYRSVAARRRLGPAGDADGALRALRRAGTALAFAEMVGGMQAALETTVAYVKEREQFGQKIAVFQAVQHQIADMALAFTAGRHLAWQAITRIDSGSEEGMELMHAAVFVPQAFKRITFSAHHLHGGAGYVVEHPLHYHSERAQALCIRYAPEAAALATVASDLLD